MAAAAAVLGGMMGFVAALIGYLVFDYSALQGLGLWSGGGLMASAALMMVGQALRDQARRADEGPISRAHA